MLQLPVLSSPATLLDDVQGLIGPKALGRSRCTSQTAIRHLQDSGLDVSPEFLRMVTIVRFAETFRKFAVCTPRQRSRPGGGGHPAELCLVVQFGWLSTWMVPSQEALAVFLG